MNTSLECYKHHANGNAIKAEVVKIKEIEPDDVVMEIYCVVTANLNYDFKKDSNFYIHYYFGRIIILENEGQNDNKSSFVIYANSSPLFLKQYLLVKKDKVFKISDTLNWFNAVSTYPFYSIANIFLKEISALDSNDVIIIDYNNHNIVLAMIQIALAKEVKIIFIARTKENFNSFSKINSIDCFFSETIDPTVFEKYYNHHVKFSVISDKIDKTTEEYLDYFNSEITFYYFSSEIKKETNISIINVINKVNFKSVRLVNIEEQVLQSFSEIECYINAGIYQTFPVKFYAVDDFEESSLHIDVRGIHVITINNKDDLYRNSPLLEVADDKYGLTNEEGIGLLEYIIMEPRPCYFISLLNNFFESRSAIKKMADYIEPKLDVQTYERHNENVVEEKIKSIWRDTIGVANIDNDDDFFDIGGDSLCAIHISYKIKMALNIDVPVYVILEKPTLSKLYDYIKNRTSILVG